MPRGFVGRQCVAGNEGMSSVGEGLGSGGGTVAAIWTVSVSVSRIYSARKKLSTTGKFSYYNPGLVISSMTSLHICTDST